MKIVDKMSTKKPNDPLEVGDVVIGQSSGDHYLTIDHAGNLKFLNLRTLNAHSREGLLYDRTHIRTDNITITFQN